MAVQSSGAISIGDVRSEFGGSAPHRFSEYYRNGSNVPSQVIRDANAYSLSGSVSDVRGGSYTTAPVINSGNLYKHTRWADNGGTGSGDVTFYVNKTATYSYYFGYYIQNSTGTSNHKLYVDGTLVENCNLTAGNYTASKTGTFSANANDAIRITCSWPSAGWASSTVRIGGTSNSNDDVQITVNSGVPTSGAVSLGDFYGTTKT